MNNTKYNGKIADFPTEVVEKMLERQVEQGNKRDVSVFEEDSWATTFKHGFSWENTIEGNAFWYDIISRKNFDLFFEKYPKQKQKMKEQELPLPRVVLVRDEDEGEWRPRVLFMIKNGKYLCWSNVETIEDSENIYDTNCWEEMKELPQKVQLTKQEIAEKFGVDVEQLEIID